MKRLFPICLALLLVGCDIGGGSSSSGPKDPISVLAMGDSETSGGNYPGVPPWPSLLAGLEPSWSVSNAAVSGERSDQGLSRLPGNIARTNPDVVVLMFGANNAIQGDLGGFQAQIQQMVSISKESGAEVVIVNILPMFGARSIYNGNVALLNEQLRSIASSEKVGYVNANGEFRGSDASERFPDGLHPDLDGTRILAVAIREGIRKRF